MFKALKDHTDDLRYQRGETVFISPRRMVSISESQELELHEDLLHLMEINEKFLTHWCQENVKGKWKSELVAGLPEDPKTGIYFHFSKKSEAVRFKLTWG